ncbi:MAG: hypothetical protein J6P31_01120, partial [Oscillospiraceae bacterium]|nr:hypothetical protein [Oscillospiraceae bacterium]
WISPGGSGAYTINYDGYMVFMCQSANNITVSDYDCAITICSAVKTDLAALAEDVYAKTEIQPLVTVTGYRLNESDGFCASNAGYKLFKFAVPAGAYLRIVSDDRFQFQLSASVPTSGTSNRVGDTTYGKGTFDLAVPQTAAYLIVSTPTVSAAKVYANESWDDGAQKVRSVLGDSKYADAAPFRGVNLFNWADAGNTWGQFRTKDGILSTGQNKQAIK